MLHPSPNSTDSSKAFVSFLAATLTLSILVCVVAGAYRIVTITKQREMQIALATDQIILNQAQELQASGDFEACSAEAEKITSKSILFSQAQSLVKGCQNDLGESQLAKARQLASKGWLKRAIDVASGITSGTAYESAQELIYVWSKHILSIAETYYYDSSGRMNDAIAVARVIGADNPVYAEAQSKIQHWQEEWQANQQHARSALVALNTDQPEVAFSELDKVAEHPYWQHRIQPILKAVNVRRKEMRRESIWSKALNAITHGEEGNALYFANQLPDITPWDKRKADIIDQANSSQRKKEFTKQMVIGCVVLLVALWLIKGSSD